VERCRSENNGKQLQTDQSKYPVGKPHILDPSLHHNILLGDFNRKSLDRRPLPAARSA